MKKVLILTLTLFVTIFVVVILGNVITIGEKFTTVFGVPYFEYAFYLLLAGLFAYLVYYAILEPMRRIHNAPEFPVLAVEDKEEGLRRLLSLLQLFLPGRLRFCRCDGRQFIRCFRH